MLIVMTVGTLVMVVGVALVGLVCSRAPVGYEDESGFHDTTEPEFHPHVGHESIPA